MKFQLSDSMISFMDEMYPKNSVHPKKKGHKCMGRFHNVLGESRRRGCEAGAEMPGREVL